MQFNEKQLQIIGTAEKLFAARGFDGTSVRDIAEEAVGVRGSSPRSRPSHGRTSHGHPSCPPVAHRIP